MKSRKNWTRNLIQGTALYDKGEPFPRPLPWWQYSSTVMVAEKAYSSIQVELVYDYNVNSVCFDSIRLG